MMAGEAGSLRMLLEGLRESSRACAILLVDGSGGLLGQAGEVAGLDLTGLASLAAGSFSAAAGLSRLVGSQTLESLLTEAGEAQCYLAGFGAGLILVVLFDRRSSAGLVRLRARAVIERLAEASGAPQQAAAASLAEITDEEIETLTDLGR